MERPITFHYEDSDKGTVFGEFFTDCPSIDILYYPEEHDDKGELIKAGYYVLLKRATLLNQPENEKVYSMGDYVVVRSKTNDWFICRVLSRIFCLGGGGESILKNFWSHAAVRKNSFRPSRGSGGMLPQKILKK